MMTYHVWQHVTSGDEYVVAVDDTGTVIEATGPLHYSEVEIALSGDFDSNPELIDGLNADSDNYRVK